MRVFPSEGRAGGKFAVERQGTGLRSSLFQQNIRSIAGEDVHPDAVAIASVCRSDRRGHGLDAALGRLILLTPAIIGSIGEQPVQTENHRQIECAPARSGMLLRAMASRAPRAPGSGPIAPTGNMPQILGPMRRARQKGSPGVGCNRDSKRRPGLGRQDWTRLPSVSGRRRQNALNQRAGR
jgi:hypothetical protein